MGEIVLHCAVFKCGRIYNTFKMVMGYILKIIRIGKYSEYMENPHFEKDLGFSVS